MVLILFRLLDSMAILLQNSCMNRMFSKLNYGRYAIFRNHNCIHHNINCFFLNLLKLFFFVMNRNPKELERAEKYNFHCSAHLIFNGFVIFIIHL